MTTEQSQSGGQPPRAASEILSAAETLADEIRERAYADADAIRARAGSESDAARAAIKERLHRLSELADGMLERLGEMRAELDELSGSLDRSSPGQAAAGGATSAGGAPEVVAASEPDGAPSAVAVPEAAAAPELQADGVDDAGARLIALNLALSDTPRDEAARQLRDQVPDAERLVAEVYASVSR